MTYICKKKYILGEVFKVVLLLLIFGVFTTSLNLVLTYKRSIVIRFFSFFQICLFGTVFSAIITLNAESFFSVIFENAFALLFYVLIVTIPITLYNFIGVELFKDFERHIKIFILPLILLSINLISFVYLSVVENNGGYSYEIIENVMNYSNFISYLFIFPIISIYYFVKTSSLIISYKKLSNSSQTKELNFQILIVLFLTYVLFIGLFLISQIVKKNTLVNLSFYSTVIVLLAVSFYIFFKLIRKNKELNEKYELIEDFSYFSVIEEGLEKYIIKDKNYLNPRLTLNECAKGIKSNEKYLSNYLNKVLNINFNTYLNNLRIEEAKVLLLSPKSEKYTIEAIAKMAGFNSKSSFNSVFKKYMNMTPSEYKSTNGEKVVLRVGRTHL